jgi:hypothetical protein
LLSRVRRDMGLRWDGAERRKGERRQPMCIVQFYGHRCIKPIGHTGDHAFEISESEARALDGNR